MIPTNYGQAQKHDENNNYVTFDCLGHPMGIRGNSKWIQVNVRLKS
jgi:hypothetical protein